MSEAEKTTNDANPSTSAIKRAGEPTNASSDLQVQWDAEGDESVDAMKPKRFKTTRKEEDAAPEPKYYRQDGLLMVEPYMFTYRTFAKGRWVGRKLIDVFNKEFMPRTPTFFAEAIEAGRIRVNDAPIPVDYVLRNNDAIANASHKHELGIRDCEVEILADTPDFLVVNKPASWPVHPTGRFFHNSLSVILQRRYGLQDLRISHRLDRPTSGVLIFTRNLAADQKIKAQIADREVEKLYVARVRGLFPPEEVTVRQPLATLLHALGVMYISPDGKDAETTFKLLASDETHSLVVAIPKTGRTHQIRVHLQYLGFPIDNDTIYNSSSFGEKKGKDADYGLTVEEVSANVKDEHAYERFEEERLSPADAAATSADYRPWCPQCHLRQAYPTEDQLCLHLHCWRYTAEDWTFEAPLPGWAKRMMPDETKHVPPSTCRAKLTE